MRLFRYRKTLLASMIVGLLASGVAVATTTATAAPAVGGPPPRRHAIQSDLTPSSSHGGVAVRGVINAVGSIKCENVGDIGIEATITENGVDVAQRRLRCVAADQCKTTVKTSFELGKKYCVRVFVASQPFPAIPGVALEADKSTFCETWDKHGYLTTIG